MREHDMRLAELKHPQKRPTYLGVKFSDDSLSRLASLLEGVPNRNPLDKLHITVTYSRAPISIESLGDIGEIPVKPLNYRFFNTRTGMQCLVLEVESEWLTTRHLETINDYGASYDFPEYKPHVTLSYDCGYDFDISKLPDVSTLGELSIVHEYYEDLRDLELS